MAKGATFTSVWARCPNHQLRVLDKDDEKCFECVLIERNLSLSPPFDVYCIDNTYEAKKGDILTVVWVIIEGRDEHWPIKGYCFEAEDGSILSHVYDPMKFIPMKFITKDNKDSWVKYD